MKYSLRNHEKIALVLGMRKFLLIMHALQKHFHDQSFEVEENILKCGACEFHILRTYRETYYLAFKSMNETC